MPTIHHPLSYSPIDPNTVALRRAGSLLPLEGHHKIAEIQEVAKNALADLVNSQELTPYLPKVAYPTATRFTVSVSEQGMKIQLLTNEGTPFGDEIFVNLALNPSLAKKAIPLLQKIKELYETRPQTMQMPLQNKKTLRPTHDVSTQTERALPTAGPSLRTIAVPSAPSFPERGQLITAPQNWPFRPPIEHVLPLRLLENTLVANLQLVLSAASHDPDVIELNQSTRRYPDNFWLIFFLRYLLNQAQDRRTRAHARPLALGPRPERVIAETPSPSSRTFSWQDLPEWLIKGPEQMPAEVKLWIQRHWVEQIARYYLRDSQADSLTKMAKEMQRRLQWNTNQNRHNRKAGTQPASIQNSPITAAIKRLFGLPTLSPAPLQIGGC